MDLARQKNRVVTVADASAEPLSRVAARYGVETLRADLSRPDDVCALAARHDLVVGAMPSVLGYRTLRAVIESGRPVVDVSFMPEDARTLDDLARDKGVTAIIDCGVAPGLSHMLAASSAAKLSRAERIAIYVGGLPVDRRWPFEDKAGFSPYDVIEEYIRPALVVEGGRAVMKEALSEPEVIDVPGVGLLEAFLTDGLRSLADTIGAPFMQEKTLRYPGHRHLMLVLRESGFFSTDTVDAGGHAVRPLDLTAALLFPQWTFEDDEADVTILRVIVEGYLGDERLRHTWDLVDRYDPLTGLRSMSRTTAFPAAIVAGLVEQGAFPPGVHPPEIIGQTGLLEVVLRGLDARGVHCVLRTEPLA